MGKKSTPAAPDPKETASAQTASNIGTAIANNTLGNVNQVTPNGSLTYTQTGVTQWTDPLSGKVYDLPQTTATQTYSPEQQAIADQQNRASLNLSTVAADQSGRIGELLGKPMTLDGAPAAGTVGGYQGLSSYGQSGRMQTSFDDAGSIQTGIANAGDITRTYGANDFSADRNKVEGALMERLQPGLTSNRQALEQRLANQGLQPGSAAYDRAYDAATRQENDARLGVIAQAGQEQSRLVGMDRDRAVFENSAQSQAYGQNANDASFGNAAQQQLYAQLMGRAQFGNDATQQDSDNDFRTQSSNNAVTQGNNAIETQKLNEQNAARAAWLNEQYAMRNQQINETTALAQGGQVTNPNFIPTQGQSMAGVDFAALTQQDYQNRVAAQQAKSAGAGALLGGLASMFSLSDKTAKKDIKKVGGLYEYRYKGEGKDAPKRIGVMAQEVEKIRPDVVRKGKDGLRRVNYGALFQAGAAA